MLSNRVIRVWRSLPVRPRARAVFRATTITLSLNFIPPLSRPCKPTRTPRTAPFFIPLVHRSRGIRLTSCVFNVIITNAARDSVIWARLGRWFLYTKYFSTSKRRTFKKINNAIYEHCKIITTIDFMRQRFWNNFGLRRFINVKNVRM